MGTLLVTRSKEFLFTLDFVKDVDLMTLEMSHEGRREKTTDLSLVPSVNPSNCAAMESRGIDVVVRS